MKMISSLFLLELKWRLNNCSYKNVGIPNTLTAK